MKRPRILLSCCCSTATALLLSSSQDVTAAVPLTSTGTGTTSTSSDGSISSISSSRPRDRSLVYGGTETSSGRHPYMASLLNGAGKQFCAGTLVAPNVVLSAAHCVDKPGQLQQVAIGRHSRHDPDDDENAEIFPVDRVINHPHHRAGFNFINDHLEHDIVLIKFRGTSKHRPIRMNFDGAIPAAAAAETKVTVMGWGSINARKERPDVLVEAELDYVPNEVCETKSGTYAGADRTYEGYITDDMMCAFAPGRDSCSGDSGGPLIVKGRNAKQDVQVGVVSWGISCGHDSFPGVYARLSYQRDFIVRELCSGDKSDLLVNYPSWCFTVGDIPTFPPTQVPLTQAPTPSPECFTLDLKFDDFPEEIGWSIQPLDGKVNNKSGAGDGAIMTRVPGHYRGQRRVIESICFNSDTGRAGPRRTDGSWDGSKYSFVLVDRSGDGMTSGESPGFYTLADSSGNLLARGNGDFKLVSMQTLEIKVAENRLPMGDEEGSLIEESTVNSEGDASGMPIIEESAGKSEESTVNSEENAVNSEGNASSRPIMPIRPQAPQALEKISSSSSSSDNTSSTSDNSSSSSSSVSRRRSGDVLYLVAAITLANAILR